MGWSLVNSVSRFSKTITQIKMSNVNFQIADGQRSLVNDISLKTRKFIGNTSMDPTLSLLMANQALAKPGDLVYDPFVGSGSLLVAAAKFGGRSFKITIDDEFFDNFAIMKIAYVAGSDIDFLMLHGKTRPSRIKQKVPFL